MPRTATLAVTVAALALAACGAADAPPTESAEPAPATAAPETFAVTSSDLQADGSFADTIIGSALAWCDGPGESVAIEWTDPPAGTESFALLMKNETRTFVYWLQFNIEPHERGVDHGRSPGLSGRNGVNSVGVRYPVAPCPEVGETHTITVTVYALDRVFEEPTMGLAPFLDGIEGHVLAEASVQGTVSGPPAG